jgi:hypothetical protein
LHPNLLKFKVKFTKNTSATARAASGTGVGTIDRLRPEAGRHHRPAKAWGGPAAVAQRAPAMMDEGARRALTAVTSGDAGPGVGQQRHVWRRWLAACFRTKNKMESMGAGKGKRGARYEFFKFVGPRYICRLTDDRRMYCHVYSSVNQ